MRFLVYKDIEGKPVQLFDNVSRKRADSFVRRYKEKGYYLVEKRGKPQG